MKLKRLSITLEKIKRVFYQKYDKNISIGGIWNIIRKNNYCYNKSYLNKVICIDESGMYENQIPNHGWVQKGKSLRIRSVKKTKNGI